MVPAQNVAVVLLALYREGHVKVVSLLLDNGADVELPDNYGQSPLFMACWKGLLLVGFIRTLDMVREHGFP